MISESLWKTCQVCKKQISVKANVCPNCGHRYGRFKKLKWVAVGLISFTVLAAIFAPDKPGRKSDTAKTSATVTADNSQMVGIPEAQSKFIEVIPQFEKRFVAAKNELLQSSLRDQRREAILASFGGQLRVTDWVGTLRKLETNGDGKAVITVRIAPNIDLLTWNNSLSDSFHGTLIDKDTQLYSVLTNMAVGDRVRVSGNFFPSDADGVFENSMTIRGAMTAPEFIFRFTEISKQ
ncbi:zinc ribbon domain-containing protein [Agrobacterium tumefaciens]|uniref:Uncharacterized protein n=1 Tax=Agrobacterium tumefaciens TaxID=358 RepID=A0A176XES4_AGRTU|nr:zinc ribbon domain-containing protein [Agrobacterium tumefaciens]OAE47860.1 hypothetical protein A7J57_06435 [Agrobacterium tumefaciens]